jgi:hypothetical protein
MIRRRAQNDMIDPTEKHEEIEKADPNEAIDPIDRADPIDPIDSTDPFEPIDRSESSDHRDHMEPWAARRTRKILKATTMRDRRRVLQATAAAALLSGAPSAIDVLRRERRIEPVAAYVREATSAIGTLLPPGRPGLVRGAIIHVGISAAVGEALARALPERHSASWGAVAGLALGVIDMGVIGRRYFPAIRALPLAPQLADHVAFGVVFALVVDR